MIFQIGLVLGWKFNNAPGICTKNEQITQWPESLGTFPTLSDINTWTAEYNAAKAAKEYADQAEIDNCNSAKGENKVSNLASKTVAQVKNWVDNNSTTLSADEIDMIKTLAIVVSKSLSFGP